MEIPNFTWAKYKQFILLEFFLLLEPMWNSTLGIAW